MAQALHFIKDAKTFLSQYTPMNKQTFSSQEMDVFRKYTFYPARNKEGKIFVATHNDKIMASISMDINALNVFFKYHAVEQPILILKENIFYSIFQEYIGEEEAEEITETDALKLFNSILKDASRKGASDIHFIWTESSVKLKYRIDGVIVSQPKSFSHSIGETIRNICVNKARESEDEKNEVAGKFKEIVDHIEREYRLSIGPSVFGYNIVIRVESKIDKNSSVKDWGYSDKALQLIESFKKLPFGIVLVTGPTGSGKSTLLYNIMAELLQEDKIVKTVEDPVEVYVDGAHQVQVNTKGLKENWMTFAKAIKMFLRQDPDVIVVGEIRDSEVAEAAFSAAKTGHLTFSTLHTNDVKSTISRLFDINVDTMDIEDGLRGIISQSLVPKLCDECKIKVENKFFTYYKRNPDGCLNCIDSKVPGYKGRVPIVEIAALGNMRENYKFSNFLSYYPKQQNIIEFLKSGAIDKETAEKMMNVHTLEDFYKREAIYEMLGTVFENKKMVGCELVPIVNIKEAEFAYEAFMRIKHGNNMYRYKDIEEVVRELDIREHLEMLMITGKMKDFYDEEKLPIFINVDNDILTNISHMKMFFDSSTNLYERSMVLETDFSKEVFLNVLDIVRDKGYFRMSFHNFSPTVEDIAIIKNIDSFQIYSVKTPKEFIALLNRSAEEAEAYLKLIAPLSKYVIVSYIEDQDTFNLAKEACSKVKEGSFLFSGSYWKSKFYH